MLKLVSKTSVNGILSNFIKTWVHLLSDESPSFPPVLLFMQEHNPVLHINLLTGEIVNTRFLYRDCDNPVINTNMPHRVMIDTNEFKQLNDGVLVNADHNSSCLVSTLTSYPSLNCIYVYTKKYLTYYDKSSQNYYLFENLNYKG